MAALSIHQAFADQVRRTPDATAVIAGDTHWSFEELDERANRLAHRLLGLGVRPEDPVAVLLGRSSDVVVAFLAVLKAGGYYLPLHPAHPRNRQQWIVEQAGKPVLLADETTRLAGLPEAGEVVLLDSPDMWAGPPVTDPGVVADRDQLAYVIFTSGSTGDPKGVAVSHRNVLGLVHDACWDTGRHERVPMVAPYAFDVSTYEIWVPLLRGGTVVVLPPGDLDVGTLRRVIQRERVTAVHLTAGLFRVVAEEDPDCLAGVREVMTGGDVVSPTAVRRVLDACPGVVVRALYGPTETTAFATSHVMRAPYRPAATVPIGMPLHHTRAYLLDQRLREVAPGAVGELYLAGGGLARGYLGRPDLTAERFVADPFAGGGERMYRTGDLVRLNSAGLLDFVERADDQVKILGFRVELAEVEATLAQHPDVADVAVVVRTFVDRERRLVAYAVPAGDELDTAAVLTSARASLPQYMVPAAVVALPALPLTDNGKLDRAALPEPDVGGDAAYRAPRTTTETALCAIFAEVLGVPRVGTDDSFFDLGGQSLQGMRMVLRIEVETGARVSIADLFDAPTPAELGAHIDRAAGGTGAGT